MNVSPRVFITGLGALTSTGLNAQESWQAILDGRSGIDTIEGENIANWPFRLGGEIKNFQPAKALPDRKLLKVISRHDVYGINAAMQAIEHSNLIAYRDSLECQDEFNDNTAVFVGSPGNKYFQQYDFLPLLAKTNTMEEFAQNLFSEVHPMWLLRILPNNVLAYTGITYGFKGVNHNITNHVVGGMQAVIEAYQTIKSGKAKRAVVVAYEAGTEPQALFYYSRLGVLSAKHLKPFDVSHDGTIVAEGAAALVLESEESVKERNATVYSEICGGLAATENQGLFSIEADGAALSGLLSNALKIANVNAADLGLVVSHGNGNIKSDESEASAIHKSLGSVPTTAFKWSMGHTLCASGILDTVLATYALKEQCIPGIASLEKKATVCEDLDVSSETRAMNATKPYGLIINRGFASMNSALIIKACE